ncbi:MAG: GldG family protein [Christensenella sp.]|nr:GldG family protein [Christensenella sp.]
MKQTKQQKTTLFNESVKINALFAAIVVFALASAFLLNVVLVTLGSRYSLSYDLTANAAYQIGDDTKQVLDGLDRDITLYVLANDQSFAGNAYFIQAQRILEQYPKYSSKINLQYVDYTADPTFAAQYPDLTLKDGDILVKSEKGLKQLPLASLFNYTYTEDKTLTIESSRAEEALTSAIVNVTTENPVRVALLTGNDVFTDTDAFKSILSDNNFEVSSVNMVTDPLSDYDILLLLAPAVDLSTDVLDKFDGFLYNNGNYGKTLLYAADVTQPATPNLDAYLREWGVAVGDGAVFETNKDRAYSYQPYYPLAAYTNADYAEKLKDSSNPVLLPLSRPLSLVYTYKDNRTVDTLLNFYETAGVRPSTADDSFTANMATEWGPMPALTLTSWVIQKGDISVQSNVIVSASSNLFAASGMANTSLSNAAYIVSLFNTLTNRESTVSIAAKSLAGNTLGITTGAASALGIVLCAVLPLAILGAGVAIWLVRRYR